MGILPRSLTWSSSGPRVIAPTTTARHEHTGKCHHAGEVVQLGGLRSDDLHSTAGNELVGTVQRDRHGVELSPQPSSDPLDPLNWKPWLKFIVLAQVSLLAFLSLMSAALITPAFVPLSIFLGRSVVQTSYVTSMFLVCAGLSALFWNPIANIYGRRPVYIGTTLVAVLMSVASGAANSYGPLMAYRSLNAFFGAVPAGLGIATVCDMFFVHERGLYTGIYTVAFITGGHLAPICGGFIEDRLSWRWCFYIPAILTAGVWVVFVLTVPETLFSRAPESMSQPRRTWKQNMLGQGRAHPTRRLRGIDFIRPFQMLRYPSVLLPTIYYAVSFAYGSILFIVTSSQLFAMNFEFESSQVGLLVGVPITVGSLLGELISGGFSDWVSGRRAVVRGERKAEDRLLAIIPSFFLTPLGIIIEGVCLQQNTGVIGVAFGIAIASLGLQVATTVVYTYTAECYKPQSPELGSIINFARQTFSFSLSFYAIPFAEAIGVQNAWIVLAFFVVVSFLPLLPLFVWGDVWRAKLGQPSFHSDL